MATTYEASRVQRLELELLQKDARIRDLEARLFVVEAQLERAWAKADDEVVTHRAPKAGHALMPCCGVTPFERLSDRMTLDAARVTCKGRS